MADEPAPLQLSSAFCAVGAFRARLLPARCARALVFCGLEEGKGLKVRVRAAGLVEPARGGCVYVYLTTGRIS